MRVLAGFPQCTHTAPSSTSDPSNGMQRVVAPVLALISSSHSLQPHQLARTKPVCTPSLSASNVSASTDYASRNASAFRNMPSCTLSSSALIESARFSIGSACFSSESRRTAIT